MDNSITLGFQPESMTIRQLPSNYLIAYTRYGGWVCDPDLAADIELSKLVLEVLFEHSVRYGDGYGVLSAVTKLKEEKKNGKS